jgi:arsenate reductase
MSQKILFLCPHSAAKSVIAAAYCQHLANQHGLDLQATVAGTEPDDQVAPAVATLLSAEGLDIASYTPRHVTREALAAAFRVISLGCDITDLAPPGLLVERWDDVPPPSQDLAEAKEIILAHVKQLVEELAESKL